MQNQLLTIHKIFGKALTIVDVFTKPFERDKNKQELFYAYFERQVVIVEMIGK